MDKPIDTSINSGLMKFTFTDTDGDVFAFFKLNPTDVRLAGRCEEIAKYFEERGSNLPQNVSMADMVRWDDELEEKICYLLGYDARSTLFGMMSATTILPDGDLFVVKVMRRIQEVIGPEVRKRKQNMQKAVNRHTAKYQNQK